MKIDDVIKDEAVQTRYKNDAHVVHQALPCGFLTALQKLTARMEKGLPLIRTPVIILHGKEDEIVPLSSSEFAMQKLGSSEKTLKTYEKMRHATLHDTGRQKVWADIIGWLDAQVRENS